ncbi:hypothetical protein ACFQX7_22845 [Luedemannella flava]
MKLLGTAAVDRRDAAALDTIDAFVTTQRRPLLALADTVPNGPRDDVLAAIAILDSVAARSQALRGAVRCGGSAGIDELGPRPRPCVASGGASGAEPRTTSGNGSGGSSHPDVIASGGLGGAATAPVPSPATATTTSAPSTESPEAAASAAAEKAKKEKKEKDDDGVLDKLGRLLGNLLGN